MSTIRWRPTANRAFDGTFEGGSRTATLVLGGSWANQVSCRLDGVDWAWERKGVLRKTVTIQRGGTAVASLRENIFDVGGALVLQGGGALALNVNAANSRLSVQRAGVEVARAELESLVDKHGTSRWLTTPEAELDWLLAFSFAQLVTAHLR